MIIHGTGTVVHKTGSLRVTASTGRLQRYTQLALTRYYPKDDYLAHYASFLAGTACKRVFFSHGLLHMKQCSRCRSGLITSSLVQAYFSCLLLTPFIGHCSRFQSSSAYVPVVFTLGHFIAAAGVVNIESCSAINQTNQS